MVFNFDFWFYILNWNFEVFDFLILRFTIFFVLSLFHFLHFPYPISGQLIFLSLVLLISHRPPFKVFQYFRLSICSVSKLPHFIISQFQYSVLLFSSLQFVFFHFHPLSVSWFFPIPDIGAVSHQARLISDSKNPIRPLYLFFLLPVIDDLFDFLKRS